MSVRDSVLRAENIIFGSTPSPGPTVSSIQKLWENFFPPNVKCCEYGTCPCCGKEIRMLRGKAVLRQHCASPGEYCDGSLMEPIMNFNN